MQAGSPPKRTLRLLTRSHVVPLSPTLCPGSRGRSTDPGPQLRHIHVMLSESTWAGHWGMPHLWKGSLSHWPSGDSYSLVPIPSGVQLCPVAFLLQGAGIHPAQSSKLLLLLLFIFPNVSGIIASLALLLWVYTFFRSFSEVLGGRHYMHMLPVHM